MIAVARRAAQLVGVVFLVALLTFVLQAALPGDAAETRVGPLPNFSPAARNEIVESTRRQLGLDRSYPEQFVRWTVRAVQGDLGRTVEGAPVRDAVGARIGASVELALVAVAIATVVAFGLAYWAYSTRLRRAATVVEALLSGLLVMPSFWIGFLLVLLFSVRLGWLPSSGYTPFGDDPVEHVKRLLLPSVTLALPYIALLFRYLYAGMQDAGREAFVTGALAKGITRRQLVTRHVLPNGVLPTVTIVGLILGQVLGGVVIVENVFGWPGLGSLLVLSVDRKDFNVVVSIVLISAVAFVVTSALVDIAYHYLDPRTRRA